MNTNNNNGGSMKMSSDGGIEQDTASATAETKSSPFSRSWSLFTRYQSGTWRGQWETFGPEDPSSLLSSKLVPKESIMSGLFTTQMKMLNDSTYHHTNQKHALNDFKTILSTNDYGIHTSNEPMKSKILHKSFCFGPGIMAGGPSNGCMSVEVGIRVHGNARVRVVIIYSPHHDDNNNNDNNDNNKDPLFYTPNLILIIRDQFHIDSTTGGIAYHPSLHPEPWDDTSDMLASWKQMKSSVSPMIWTPDNDDNIENNNNNDEEDDGQKKRTTTTYFSTVQLDDTREKDDDDVDYNEDSFYIMRPSGTMTILCPKKWNDETHSVLLIWRKAPPPKTTKTITTNVEITSKGEEEEEEMLNINDDDDDNDIEMAWVEAKYIVGKEFTEEDELKFLPHPQSRPRPPGSSKRRHFTHFRYTYGEKKK